MKIVVLVLLIITFISAKERVYTTKFSSTPPVLDGIIDDSVWDLVEWQTDFIQSTPNRGDKGSQRTDFKIVYDKENLYVAFKAYDSEPDKISTRVTEHDNFGSDWVEINLDSYNDNRTAFSFTAMVCGSNGDEYISEDGSSWDGSWNPVWSSKTSLVEDGWCAEMKIPFSQLRFQDIEEQIWGMQVSRIIYRTGERTHWQELKKNDSWVSAMGVLKGIKGIENSKKLEILPYNGWKVTENEEDPNNPFRSGNEGEIRFGLDGKYMISQNLAADFTINPDFGQVEADPAEISLSSFETYQRERRPFFIEGKDLYDFSVTPAIYGGSYSSDNLFYSRRIGATPNGRRPSATYMKLPHNTNILGAVKLTGKNENGISIGVLESVTNEEIAEYIVVDSLSGNIKKESIVEPYTNYFVGRVKYDYNNGNSFVGGMGTSMVRSKDEAEKIDLHHLAHSGGLDFYHRFGDEKSYNIYAKLIYSRVEGSKELISKDQLSFPRYYKRVGATHLDYDSTKTFLDGHGGTFRVSKSKGTLRTQAGFTWRSPGLELNDMGFLNKPDYIAQWYWAGYEIENPVSWLKEYSINFNQRSEWDYDFNHSKTTFNLNTHLNFKTNFNLNLSSSRRGEMRSFTELRGGPDMLFPGYTDFSINFNSDYTKPFTYSSGVNGGIGDEDYYLSYSPWVSLGYKVNDQLTLSFNPSYNYSVDKDKFVGVYSSVTNEESNYIFAELERKTFNFSFRVNYIATPTLSIKYYGRPYLSSGDYSNYKKVLDSESSNYDKRFKDLESDTIGAIDEDGDGIADFDTNGEPDFNGGFFQSNFVVRWDYTMGSTIYFVWSQSRGFREWGDSSFSLSDGFSDLFDRDGEDIFMIKYNYWINI